MLRVEENEPRHVAALLIYIFSFGGNSSNTIPALWLGTCLGAYRYRGPGEKGNGIIVKQHESV